MLAYRIKNGVKTWLRRPWTFLRHLPDRLELFGARILAKLFPRLFAIEHDRLYPPAKICTSTEWITNNKTGISELRHVDTACAIHIELPNTVHNGVRRQFLADRDHSCPSTFVVTIPNGRVWGEGFVISPDGQLLGDISIDFLAANRRLHNVNMKWKLDKLIDYDCTVAVLSTSGAMLYWHWMFQLLPRFELIKLAGINIDAIDFFVVNGLKSNFQIETLEILGLRPERLIQSSNVPHLRARRLIAPSVPLSHGCYRPWMVRFLRKSFLGDENTTNISPRRRVYISRGMAKYRRVLNEASVIQFLRLHGFEEISLETISVRQQASVIAECEVIVAPHGGGLSNVVFCSSGTKVIEIFSPELVAGYYWKLCNQLNLSYYYIIGKANASTVDSNYQQTWNAMADIEVDIGILASTLKMANVSKLASAA
jgi:hypothetical protein